MFNRLFAIAKKETRQMLRDIRMLMVIFVFPVFLLGIFGYAINFDVRHIKLAVYDPDRSEESRGFIDILLSSEYFDLVEYIDNNDEIKKYLDEKKSQSVVVFPEDFSEKINSRENVKLQFLIDGVDGNTATIIMNYINAATLTYSQTLTADILTSAGMKSYMPVRLEPRFWYNPELKSTHFLLPGLIAMILIVTAVITISLSIVREKERGTIEQINVSPLTTMELLVGKTIPYVVIALINAALVLIAGYFLFGIIVKGSYFWLFVTTLIFLFASLNLGILVSTISDTQQVAFQLSTLITLLPSMLLSGFIFPIESMPVAVQVLTNVTPAKFYIVALRAILLKGVGIEAFWDQLLYLIAFSLVLLAAASVKYKKSIER